MAQLISTDEKVEKFILVAVQTDENPEAELSLKELGALAETAGALVLGRIIQNRQDSDPKTYIGKGKIEEVKALILSAGADGIICDDELSPGQCRNLEDALGAKVLDRTLLILDIFALHATTSEGRLQVLMAQLKDRQTRLSGQGTALSRLGGGIGTRGPGESKLESDRRVLKNRISMLRSELDDIAVTRETERKKRQGANIPVVAIVGYTNAGKSTLLNYLTGAGVLAEDKLFATLDATTRKLTLNDGGKILLTDTVGFISKLPHHLVDAFRSTLEEARYADIILHIVDASNDDAALQMKVVYDTLEKLGIGNRPVICAMNKLDLCAPGTVIKDLKADRTVRISAKTGAGVDDLLKAVSDTVKGLKKLLTVTLSYNNAGGLSQIHQFGHIIREEYREDGIYIQAMVPEAVAKKYQQ